MPLDLNENPLSLGLTAGTVMESHLPLHGWLGNSECSQFISTSLSMRKTPTAALL
jgi:hypothetical protein